MKTTKRMLAILLTVAMLITTLCMPAFAVDATPSLTEKTATADEIKALLEGDYALTQVDGIDEQTVTYMGNNCYRVRATEVGGSVANKCCKLFETAGFTPYVDKGGNKYLAKHIGGENARNQMYVNDKYLVAVFWDDANNLLTVTMEPLPADAGLREEYLSVFTAPVSTEKVCDPVVIQVGLTVTDVTVDGVTSYGAYSKTIDNPQDIRSGMSYVFRLSDGSFVIYDGGLDNATSTEDAELGRGGTVLRKNIYRLQDILRTYAPNPDDIRIAAWFITHPHVDHYTLFEQWVEEMYDPTSEYYTDYAGMTLERVIANYPDYDQMDNCTDADSSSACAHLKESKLVERHEFLAKCETYGIFVYKAHAGQTYYLADAKLVILHTAEIATEAIPNAKCGHEDGDQACSNRLSVITQMILPVNGYDVTFMMTGDAESYNAGRVNELYGVAMKSDFLQAPHHGANSMGDTFYYDNVAAPYFMVPTSNNRWNGDENGGWFGDDKPLVLQYEEGRTGLQNVKYSLSEGVTTFIAGDMSHEFSLSVTDGVLSVTDISLLWCRGDIRRYMKADGNYKLIADLSFDDQFCTYMDAAGDPTTFSGTLDGMGHTLTFPSELENTSALFGTLSGTVKNLNVGTKEATVKLNYSGTEEVCYGVIVNEVTGSATLTNVHLWATVDYTDLAGVVNIGGFIGSVNGALTVTGCSANGSMTHNTASTVSHGVGGFIGDVVAASALTVNFDSCENNMTINDKTKTTSGAGGFIGRISTATATVTMTDCVNTGDVSITLASSFGGASAAGGIVGVCHVASNLTLTGCVNTGDVSTGNKSGGILGTSKDATVEITNCVNRGDVSGANVGGIVAYTNKTDATSEGESYLTVQVLHCVNYGAVNGTTRCGGMLSAGEYSATIDSCVNVGTVTSDGKASTVGSMYGRRASISNCVTLTKAKYNGGSDEENPETNSTLISVSQTNEGAGVRIVLDDKGTGLRFKFAMDTDSLADLKTLTTNYGVDNVQVGAIFLPTTLLGEDALTAENYSNALITEGTASAVEGGCYYASLVNLYEDHYTTAYSCQSFWRFRTSADSEWITVYANNTETRIIAEVADDALADYNDPNNENKPNYSDEQIQLLEKYAAANH
ncbi:MAG: hypothetical protein IKA44_05005 [Clostridia bacterium]|nr:hypothetical protein [Clostridia bacterium]